MNERDLESTDWVELDLALLRSIEARGLLMPLDVTRDGRVIHGKRRLKCCRTLGITEIPVRILDLTPQQIEEHMLLA